MSLEDLIRDKIKKSGPMPVAEYMSLALSHPDLGYYMGKDPIGARGDFTTAPEISQIFGELIGAWLAEQWIALERPKAALIELGPGRGTLMMDILRGTKNIPGFHEAISVHLVETSPALKKKQWQLLAGAHHDIDWHASLADLPEKPWLLVANEFFDALPIRQFRHEAGGWQERMVTLENDRLGFTFAPLKKPPASFTGAAIVDGEIYEHCEEALKIAGEIGARLSAQGGAGLIVDYGYSFTASKNQKAGGDTLQAVKNHAWHDILSEPGTADLTAHVDFVALKHAAILSGALTYGPVTQGAFLRNLGAIIRAARLCQQAGERQKAQVISGLERLMSIDGMGDLFKVLALTGADHPKPEGF